MWLKLLEWKLVVVAPFTLLALCGRWHWGLDLFCNWHPQYMLISLSLAVVFAVTRQWKRFGIAVIVMLANAIVVLPYAEKSPVHHVVKSSEHVGEEVLQLITANVLQKNSPDRDYTQVPLMLAEMKPDLVALQESGGIWRTLMQQWKEQFPHQSITSMEAYHHELSFLATSRTPWRKLQRVPLNSDRWSMGLAVEFEWKGRVVSLLNVHARHPTSQSNVEKIREWHDGIAGWVKEKKSMGHAVIVMGDFNCTPWMSIYREMSEKLNLNEAGKGHPFAATWGNCMPIRMMIDHIFTSDDWQILGWKVLGSIDSDHRPVMVKMRLKQEES